MPRPAVGARVGAVQSATNESVRLYGFGVYEGDFVPDEKVVGMGAWLREDGVPNPRIKLDSGQYVYGCECWWGSEESIRRQLFDGREVIEVDITKARAEVAASWQEAAETP